MQLTTSGRGLGVNKGKQMTVTVGSKKTVPVKAQILEVTFTLKGYDAQVFRSMLGGLSRAERRASTRRNGGSKASGDRARFLVKEIIDAMDKEGVVRLSEVAITPPDQQLTRAARGR